MLAAALFQCAYLTHRKPRPIWLTRISFILSGLLAVVAQHSEAAPADRFAVLYDAWQQGDQAARNELVALLHREIERLAALLLRRNPSPRSMMTGDLVNEAVLRLLESPRVSVNDQPHLMALCARIMRFVIVDGLRHRHARKRDAQPVTLTTAVGASPGPDLDALALEAALERLHAVDPQKAQIVEMRYFAAMTIEEVSVAMNLSPATVKRAWQSARAWLQDALEHHGPR